MVGAVEKKIARLGFAVATDDPIGADEGPAEEEGMTMSVAVVMTTMPAAMPVTATVRAVTASQSAPGDTGSQRENQYCDGLHRRPPWRHAKE